MANGYKAPKGLGSAVRGRSMVTRNYTAGIEEKAKDREVTLGLVQSIAGGIATYSQALGENVKSWEQAEAGAREVFKSSGLKGSFEDSGYKGAASWKDKYFKTAGEVSDTQIIGNKEFSTSFLEKVGEVDRVTASKMGDKKYDKHGNPSGYLSLYKSGKSLESGVGGITASKDANQVKKNKTTEKQKQKQNAVTPSAKAKVLQEKEAADKVRRLAEKKAAKAKRLAEENEAEAKKLARKKAAEEEAAATSAAIEAAAKKAAKEARADAKLAKEEERARKIAEAKAAEQAELDTAVNALAEEAKRKIPTETVAAEVSGNIEVNEVLSSDSDGTQVVKDNVVENQKQNATGGLAPEVDEPSYKQWKEIAGNEDKRMADYFEQYPT